MFIYSILLNTVNNAWNSYTLITRKPGKVIHHSDQGSQYTSVEFGKRCKEMGVRPSMSSVGDAYDNAMAERFFASLGCELIDRHSGLGYLSPNNFERKLNENNQIEINFNPLLPVEPSRFHEKLSVKMGQLQFFHCNMKKANLLKQGTKNH